MKKLLLAGALLLVFGLAGAQKVYFIYIQSDNNTPFFIKTGDKVTSSTASGYVILSNLVDSVYQFTVGKNGQAAVESRFSIPVNKQDKGFLLKEAEGKFSLFDLQAMTLLQPLALGGTSAEPVEKRTDAFTVLLAQAANDPSLLEIRATPAVQKGTATPAEPAVAVATTTAPQKEEPQPETTTEDTTQTQVTANSDTTTSEAAASATGTPENRNSETATPPVTDAEKETTESSGIDTVQQSVVSEEQPKATIQEEAPVYKPSVVTRRSESSTSEGFGLVFLDDSNGTVDTIRILIPNQNAWSRNDPADVPATKKFLEISSVDTTTTGTEPAVANETATTRLNKNCDATATEGDFFKLRRNMAAKEKEEAMIREAKKYFRKACFTTEQIRNLSGLFLTASGKFQFFDAAYPYVSDREQYAALQTEIHDNYYADRFKELIAK
jgi:hypothetical protein